MQYGSQGFKKVTKLKSQVVLQILKAGYDVVWSVTSLVSSSCTCLLPFVDITVAHLSGTGCRTRATLYHCPSTLVSQQQRCVLTAAACGELRDTISPKPNRSSLPQERFGHCLDPQSSTKPLQFAGGLCHSKQCPLSKGAGCQWRAQNEQWFLPDKVNTGHHHGNGVDR